MKQHKLALFTICLGFFIVILDATIVNATVPAIAKDLHTNLTDLQWMIAGYTLSFVCLLLLAGNLVDRFGGRWGLAFGLIAFTITSLACALAPSANMLIIFRLLQGASATTLIPATLNLINTLYTEPGDRAKAIGVWGGIGGTAAACGPLIASILISAFSWRSIFFINVPICIISLLMLSKTIPHLPVKGTKNRFDWGGFIFFTLFAFGISFACIEGGRIGWYNQLVVVPAISGLICLAIFLWIEKGHRNPIVPLHFFKLRHFSVSVISALFMYSALFSAFFLLPLYFSHIKHYPPSLIGFAILPQVAFIAVTSYISGYAIAHWGTRKPIILGLLVSALGFLLLYATTRADLSYAWMVLPLCLSGFGFSFAAPAVIYIATNSVPGKKSGIASGVYTTSRQLGSLLGVAVYGSMVASSSSFLFGFHLTLICCTAQAILVALLNLPLKPLAGRQKT